MFNFDKNLSPSPPPPPFFHPTVQTCLFMLGACILFGAPWRSLPENQARPSPWAHVTDASIPLPRQDPTQNRRLLLILLTINYLPPDRILPSSVKSKSHCLMSGPQQEAGRLPQVPRSLESGPPFWDAPSLAQGSPLRLRARTSRSPCPACWPEAKFASGSWGLGRVKSPE